MAKDLRTKINELPICEDMELIDTLIAIGTDGKTYRVNKDNVGGKVDDWVFLNYSTAGVEREANSMTIRIDCIQFDELFNIVKAIGEILPEGENTLNLGSVKLEVDKKDNSIKIQIVDNEAMDLVKEYKENIKLLDDEIFVKATEELSKSVNINYFNTLLEKEKLTPYELDVVGQYIAKSNDIISDAINTEIARLEDLLDRF